jgi:hypothetical protein
MGSTYILRKGHATYSDLIDDQPFGGRIRLDTVNGNDGNSGETWSSAKKTMSSALDAVQTAGQIDFVGDVREELTGSNLKFDITIRGMGSLHHPDLPSSSYHPGASMWRPPASPTAATPLLDLRGRGWNFANIAFDCPVDDTAVVLSRNALSATSEYDASHASFIGCRFLSGLHGIEDAGGGNNITIKDCEFAGMTGAAIYGSSTAVANPRVWKIYNNIFPSHVGGALGNVTHIDAALNESIIEWNKFGTVVSTALYVDLTGGNDNIVTNNFMMGAYNTGDYISGTGDSWFGNQAISISFGTSGTNASGVTIGVPEAAS